MIDEAGITESGMLGIKVEPGQSLILLDHLEHELRTFEDGGGQREAFLSATIVLQRTPTIIRKLCPEGPFEEIIGDDRALVHEGITVRRYFRTVVSGIFMEEVRVKMRAYDRAGQQQVVLRHYRFFGVNRFEEIVRS